MAGQSRTIYRDAGKPDEAVPVSNSCALSRAAAAGELTGSPIPIERTTDAAEILWPEIWPAAHDRELWRTAPDGTCTEQWKNDATSWSFE
jgi:hypothetical protein